jgi:hypothetical protein
MKNINLHRVGLAAIIIGLPLIGFAKKHSLRVASVNAVAYVSAPVTTAATEPLAAKIPVNVMYRVQILALQHPINVQSVSVDGIEGKIYSVAGPGITRYYMGEFKNLQAANDFKTRLVQNGFEDACIVAYNNGQRITIKESLSLLGDSK